MPRKILILDDDAEVVALLAQAFAPSPYEVVFCTSGVAAIIAIFEAYKDTRPFEALIMDCALPWLDGFTIARIVRLAETTGIAKPAKIAYFTAFTRTVEQSTLLQEVGAEAYWRKPEDTGNLPTLIQLWLEGAELGEPLARSVSNGSL